MAEIPIPSREIKNKKRHVIAILELVKRIGAGVSDPDKHSHNHHGRHYPPLPPPWSACEIGSGIDKAAKLYRKPNPPIRKSKS